MCKTEIHSARMLKVNKDVSARGMVRQRRIFFVVNGEWPRTQQAIVKLLPSMRMLERGKLNGIYEEDWRDVNAHNVAIVCELYSLNTFIFLLVRN